MGAARGVFGRREAARLNTRVSKFNVDDVYFFKDAVAMREMNTRPGSPRRRNEMNATQAALDDALR